MKKQIFKNLFSNYLGNFVSMLLGFLIVPFLIRVLGKDAFGVSVLAESLIIFFQVFAFSLRIALSRHATIAFSQGNIADFNGYISSGRYILNIAALAVFFPGLLISIFFPAIFNVPEQFYDQSRILFFLIILSFVISMPNMVYWAALYANQRFDLINYSNFGGLILRAVSIFVLFKILPPSKYNLVLYGVIYFLMVFGQNIIIYIWCKRLIPNFIILKSDKSSDKIKELISFGGYASLSGIAASLYETVMNIAINMYMGPSINAIYSISIKIPAIVKRIFLDPAVSLAPTFAALVASNDKDRLINLFVFYSKVINMIVFPLGFILTILSSQIIFYWVGTDFEASAQAMPLFLGAVLLSLPLSICNGINNAFGNIKTVALVNFMSSLVNVGLGLYLAFKLDLGIKGIGLSAIILNALTYSIFMPIYACKSIEMSIATYWTQTLVKPLILTIVTFGISYLIYTVIFTDLELVPLLGSFILVSCVYLFFTYVILFSPTEKNSLHQIKNSALKKFGIQ